MGSRAIAFIIDQLLRLLVAGAVIVLLLVIGPGNGWTAAIGIVAVLLIVFGYDVLFEVLASGRTPGKRWSGLRVVREGARPIGWGTSLVRNVLRLVDVLPGVYAVGGLCIVLSARNQRLGDLAAGTLVVRERRGLAATEGTDASTRGAAAPTRAAGGATPTPAGAGAPSGVAGARSAVAEAPSPVTGTPAPAPSAHASLEPRWDVSAVGADELALARGFLERRESLTAPARAHLAAELAELLRTKVGGAHGELSDEAFLEGLVEAKSR